MSIQDNYEGMIGKLLFPTVKLRFIETILARGRGQRYVAIAAFTNIPNEHSDEQCSIDLLDRDQFVKAIATQHSVFAHVGASILERLDASDPATEAIGVIVVNGTIRFAGSIRLD